VSQEAAVHRPDSTGAAVGGAAVGGSLADGPPLRDDLADLEPYGAPQVSVPVALNTNENPYPPSAALARAVGDAVAAVAGGLNRYPDRDATQLRKDLADYLGHGLTGREVWAANGSNEVIQQLLQAFGGPGRSALGFEPSYSMHPLIARVTSTQWIAAGRGDDFSLAAASAADFVRSAAPDLVFLTSPNNPTGTSVALDVISAVCDVAPGMVVVDEAYAEFAREGTPSALTLLPRYPRLVVTRTMSKAFAMAGARIGYMAASPEVVDALLVVRLPYHLSSVTQAVARAALAHAAEPLASVAALRSGRDVLVSWLRERGLRVADSDANFALFGEFADRHVVWQGLLDRGVLVREVGPPAWLRVTVGTPEEMTAFRGALDEVLSEGAAAPPAVAPPAPAPPAATRPPAPDISHISRSSQGSGWR
jgi:histidinol-phosphate aminotransferase